MVPQLGTKEGRVLYGLRKQKVEILFGIIKPVMGWRQMSMRVLDNAQGEWSGVTMERYIKRIHLLISVSGGRRWPNKLESGRQLLREGVY
ncbi:hypothetical protein B9Z51_16150 [Limnohabitans sp. T6-5]|nr:hypothetical protein B9Z51_16150 [Limnohabitans sp. T6-5]